MNLIVDVGNTRVKLAVFNNNELVDSCAVNYNVVIDAIKKYQNKYKINKAIVSNVSAKIDGLEEYLKNNFSTIILNSQTKLPIKINYTNPETLGVDRRALAVAGNQLYPNGNCLVIDMGTCITYDFVTSDGEYLGGAISPGMRMRFKSMHEFTESLPLVDGNVPKRFVGKNTQESINNGVVLGISAEIDGYISGIQAEKGDVSVLITGGDASFFEKSLKNSIFADSILLLYGLNIILRHNEVR
ncbi:MAG: type III pantothenate kinase [Ichthyobacteriaceae bacterium]|nr:type III pantothenate kinase [Ichthyobacteriaceae bacterium]